MDIFTMPSWLFLSAILILFLFNIFLYALTSIKSSMKLNLPPSPLKLPIIGNLHQLLSKHRHQALWQLSHKFGPVMLLHFGAKPYIIISSSVMAEEVLKTKDLLFCTRPYFKSTKTLTYNYLDIAFSPYDNHCKEMRKVFVSELLGPKRAGLFNNVTEMEIDDLVRSLSLNSPGTAINLEEKLLALVFGIVCKIAFGKSYKKESSGGVALKKMLEEAKHMLGGSIGDHFPIIGPIVDKLSGWNHRLEKCFSNLDRYAQTILEEHLETGESEINEHEKDFVHALIDLSTNTNTGESPLTKDDMKALIMDVLTGGTDTIVGTMVWAMAEIARNPRVMNKLQKEIRSCIGMKQKVRTSDITKMTYLKMVVKETLRLHPTAPLLIPRECLQRCKLGGYDVLPGTRVLVNAWGIGRDPITWGDNSSEFYPERFNVNLEGDFRGSNFDMVPFGGGRRSCPAVNQATTITELTIANLFYWFDWEVPNGLRNEQLDMEEEGSLVVLRRNGLSLVPRNHNWQQ
uniref:parthenolide synthase-like n=1 Tax=Erigeron canadensis TaxID=72917 RepID=UPI001CB94671|nr:parthenolide synthase-like [Erigeron canadensis]